MRFIQQTLLAIALSTAVSTSVRAQSKVEYFWDTDPGVGKGQVLQSFTGSGTVATAELDVGALSTGIHTLGLRALNNTWFSATYHRSFFIPAPSH